MRYCTKYWAEREIIFGNELPDLRLISDKQVSAYIKETDFPWFPPTEDPGDSEPDNQSITSSNGVPPMASPVHSEESYIANLSINDSIASETSNNPGYALFEEDLDEDHESNPDEIILPPSDNEADTQLDNFLISPNDNPLPLLPNRAHLDPASNWLQSSSGSEADPDHDQFLLNADDMYSDDAFSSYSSSNNDGNEGNNLDDFEINDIYIDDNIEPTQDNTSNENVNYDLHNDSELNHYLLAPDGVYLENQSFTSSDDDMLHDLDPEPSPGPVDPG